MVALHPSRGGHVTHDCPGHREGEDIEWDWFDVVLVLREADAGPRHGVPTDGLPRGVAGGSTLSHRLDQLSTGLRRDPSRHGAGEYRWWSGRLWARVAGG